MGNVIPFTVASDVLDTFSIDVATRNGEIDFIFHPDGMTQRELLAQVSDVLWAAGRLEDGDDSIVAEVQIYMSGRIVTQIQPEMVSTKKQIAWFKRAMRTAKKTALSDA